MFQGSASAAYTRHELAHTSHNDSLTVRSEEQRRENKPLSASFEVQLIDTPAMEDEPNELTPLRAHSTRDVDLADLPSNPHAIRAPPSHPDQVC